MGVRALRMLSRVVDFFCQAIAEIPERRSITWAVGTAPRRAPVFGTTGRDDAIVVVLDSTPHKLGQHFEEMSPWTMTPAGPPDRSP
jgi:hypothetical protein